MCRHGRSIAEGGAGPFPAGPSSAPSAGAPPVRGDDDITLSRWENNYDHLSDEPLKFNVAVNDDAHSAQKAHTVRDHGPQLPLRSIPDVKTVEGRIHGDSGWRHAANASTKWSDPSTMNRTINEYVRGNWAQIRSDLAIEGKHEAVFDAGHRIGEGFVNRGMGGAGSREAQYVTTSVVRLVIKVVPGSDPPDVYIKTSFPAALG
ncbi:hypothetical protein ACIA5D_41335 [Actinoplanes sp. NPDC051513]|uniref:hypothetical protein n=1 Tax=Actinoplanes sp. NPDC051513 TaxID=3363908 RepID=UPI0037A2D236